MKHVGGRRGRMVAMVFVGSVVFAGCGGPNEPSDYLVSGTAPNGSEPAGSTAGTPPPADPGFVPARLLSPLSGSIVTSRQPLLRWTPRQTTDVEICADRACDIVLHTFRGRDGQGRPQIPLPAGTVYWRVVPNRGPTAVWQMVIPARDSGRSTAWGVVPDYNGDGLADVAVGAPAPGSGSVPVFFGGFSLPFDPGVTLTGGAGFGRAVAAAGDVNGDGFVDLAVASIGSGAGAVTIYYGGTGGLSPGPTLYPEAQMAGFGATIASAGDFDHDGYGDLVVGGRQRAQLFRGGAGGINLVPAVSIAAPSVFGGEPDASNVQGPADVNGDGAPDLLIGGAIFHGTGAGFPEAPNLQVGPIASFAGDVNGDGLGDLATYAVPPGTPDGIDPQQFLLAQAGEFVFTTAGDIDADGYSDVVAGISSLVGVPERERVYFGAATACGTTGCRAFAPLIIPGHDQAGNNLRVLIAAAGDVSGDGGADLVVATPESGTVALYRGGDARELPLNFAFPIWTGAAGSFGSSIASLFGTTLPAL